MMPGRTAVNFSTSPAPPPSSIVEQLFDMWGVIIALRTDSDALLDAIVARLPMQWQPATDMPIDRVYTFRENPHRPVCFGPAYDVTIDGRTVERALNFEAAVKLLAFDLEPFVAGSSPRFVIVHAGVVGWRGRAIVIPGKGFTGKSTLTAALIHQGADYLSDEYALVDENGLVHPFPRALNLRQPVVPLPHHESPRWTAGLVGPLPVGLVLFTHYEPGAEWKPLPLGHGDAVLDTFANTNSARQLPRRVLRILDRMLMPALATRSPRGDALATAAQVLQLLSRHSQIRAAA